MNAATAAAQTRAAAVRGGREARLGRATQVCAFRSPCAGPAAPAGCRSLGLAPSPLSCTISVLRSPQHAVTPMHHRTIACWDDYNFGTALASCLAVTLRSG